MMRFTALLSIVVPAVLAGENKWGVGKLPALGWNSWNAYKCDITEAKFMSAAEKIVELGLRVLSLLLPIQNPT
jgi:alpha-galactosidase